jgi:membrane fusion protein, multidrug efflux system
MLDYARIRSPIDGITGVRLVDPGNLVHPSDPNGIVVVTQIDPISVLFTLPQDDLPRVTAAMKEATLKVSALSRDGGTVLGEGELALVDNQINAATATIRLKAVFPNPAHTLWPNQFVKTRLLLGMRKNAVVAPAVAIQNGPAGQFVYLVGADKTATPRPVEVALIDSDLAIIAKGLEVGETVVTEGQFQLKPGSLVDARVKDAGGAPTGGRAGRRVAAGEKP